jgi:hypothetical protein
LPPFANFCPYQPYPLFTEYRNQLNSSQFPKFTVLVLNAFAVFCCAPREEVRNVGKKKIGIGNRRAVCASMAVAKSLWDMDMDRDLNKLPELRCIPAYGIFAYFSA